MQTIGSPLLWGGFLLFVLLMLALDLGVLRRNSKEVSTREALIWSCVWVSLSLLFSVGVYFMFGGLRATEFLTGYFIEKSLSVDNIFVFVLIFGAFSVPKENEHRILLWGILGALVMRAVLIFAGAAILERFHWVIYLFGAFLVITGVKLLLQKEEEAFDPKNSWIMRQFRKVVRSTDRYEDGKFFTRKNGLLHATPLFAVLVCIEVTDLIFAVDSIPAVFAVTSDPFIVFTSNIFAILGLRSMYFLLAGVVDKFHYLKTGLAFVLAFVGVKMLIMSWVKIPALLSLFVVLSVLSFSIIASFLWPKKREPDALLKAPLEADQPAE
jgi:tellurite resistance protein TerC